MKKMKKLNNIKIMTFKKVFKSQKNNKKKQKKKKKKKKK